jgi:hypothetical protein
LKDITNAFRADPNLENLLFNDFFNKAIHKAQPGWRRIVAQAALWGIPTPAFSTALSFFDGYRTAKLPASLLQAQRDYFGAHTFRILPEHANDNCQWTLFSLRLKRVLLVLTNRCSPQFPLTRTSTSTVSFFPFLRLCCIRPFWLTSVYRDRSRRQRERIYVCRLKSRSYLERNAARRYIVT